MSPILAYSNRAHTGQFKQHLECDLCARRKSCLVARLVQIPKAAGWAPKTTKKVYQAGEFLYEQGQSAGKLQFISSGTVKLFLTDASGDQQILGFPGAGDMVGLDAVRSGEQAASAQALETTAACEIDSQELFQCLSATPAELSQFVTAIGERGADSAARLLLLGQKNAEQRLAAFLLEIVDRQRRAGLRTETIQLPMSRAEIGRYLSLAVETVSRLLTRIQSSGHIRVHRHAIEIVCEPGLRKVAEASA